MKKENLIARTLKKIAPRIGAKIFMEPKWGRVGQINFASGRKRYFRYSTLDLNRVGASDMAKDKDYAKFFMKKMGYPVVTGKAFASEHWATLIKIPNQIKAAVKHAEKIGWPVIVKPNSKSQGTGVTKVYDKQQFEKAFDRIADYDKMILVEEFAEGKDYRIVVLDNRVISAYERIPLSVTGDSSSSIHELLEKKQRMFKRTGRDTIIDFKDERMIEKLKLGGFDIGSILYKGEYVQLLDNANLSTGGDSLDVTNIISKGFKDLSVRVTKDMGLRLCGVDLITRTPISEKPVKGNHWILEINAAPGLDHYALIGKEQQQIVEELYLEVLKAMDKDL